MPLLIDCLNVLHAPMPSALAGLDIAELCRTLARTPWARDEITVVCDGHPGPLGLLESPTDRVTLVYSGVGRTADEVIIQMIQESSAPRRLIVVSSDHAIRHAARHRRATSWPSDMFLRRLVEALREAGEAGPTTISAPDEPLDADEVQRWMAEFGYGDPDEGTADPGRSMG